MDYDKIRNDSIRFCNLSFLKMNKEYQIYYDETNNSRLFKITDEGFNYDEKAYFILGGLIFEKENLPSDESIKELFDSLELQDNMKEIKFKHIKQKAENFIEFLTKPRGQKFVEWLFKNKYWVHYAFRDNFYYSIVDIIDSMEESAFLGLEYNRELKNTLYTYIKADKTKFLNILRQFGYPNITDQIGFIETIIDWIEMINQTDNFNLELIRQSIKSYKKQSLIFLNNNQESVTIKGYDDIYRNRIYMFANAKHTFDNENIVESKINNTPVKVSGKTVKYKFIDSKDSQLVQLSDITVGILGMWLEYLERKTVKELALHFNKLSSKEKESLMRFQIILKRSLEENIAFKLGISSDDFEQKIAFFLDFDFTRGITKRKTKGKTVDDIIKMKDHTNNLNVNAYIWFFLDLENNHISKLDGVKRNISKIKGFNSEAIDYIIYQLCIINEDAAQDLMQALKLTEVNIATKYKDHLL